jgi:hypothetical protein
MDQASYASLNNAQYDVHKFTIVKTQVVLF